MNDHCIHNTKPDTEFEERNWCCRCLHMSTFESVLRRMDCMDEKERMHDADEWHKVWEARE